MYNRRARAKGYFERVAMENFICEACKKETNKQYRTSNGDFFCETCYNTTVTDINCAGEIYEKVKKELEAEGFEPINGFVGLFLVDKADAQQIGENVRGYFSPITESISSIKILTDMAYVDFLTVLAHEHIHAWLHHNTPLGNESYFCEGFAQIGAYIIAKKNPSYEMEVCLRHLADNKDLIYGNHFQYMLMLLEKYGLHYLIAKAKEGKKF